MVGQGLGQSPNATAEIQRGSMFDRNPELVQPPKYSLNASNSSIEEWLNGPTSPPPAARRQNVPQWIASTNVVPEPDRFDKVA